MRGAREKRQLLGLLALLAPLPLPFNRVISWPVLGLYLLAILLMLLRASRDEESWLPVWAMNLLGLAYLPLFLIDLAASFRGSILRPLVHLALFTLAVKLMGMRRENEKWHAMVLVFFLFLAAMGTSVHLSVTIFLALYLGLSLYVLARFATLHMLAAQSLAPVAEARVPLRGFVLTATLLALLGAVPFFVLLPRIKTPYLVAPGGAGSELLQSGGFFDRIGLDSIGRVRGNPGVALRVRYQGSPPAGHEMRFRAAVYERYREGSWLREPVASRRLDPGAEGLFRLVPGVARTWAEVWRQPDGTSSLPVPVDALSLEMPVPSLLITSSGAVVYPFTARTTLRYRVGLGAPARMPGGQQPPASGSPLTEMEGVTPAIAGLAARVMGEGTAAGRAARLERHLMSEYGYTLDLLGRRSDNPVEDFLFRWREGHCEYFASAMVMMLRSQGIPARLVTGFLGGDYNPLEGYFIVRYSNAHAWVEAHVGSEGWRTYDPTPSAGRPRAGREGLRAMLGRAYDFLVFRWDRYVLTFGFDDQVGFLLELRNRLKGLWLRLSSGREEEVQERDFPDSEKAAPPSEQGDGRPEAAALGIFLLLAVALAWWLWRHRPPLTASRAYRLLRRRVARSSQGWPDSLAPLAAVERIGESFPAAEASSRRLVELYLRESFGEELLAAEDLRELGPLLRSALGSMHKAS